jgi:hypothetical protein
VESLDGKYRVLPLTNTTSEPSIILVVSLLINFFSGRTIDVHILSSSHRSRSHSTTPLLFPPTTPSFTLDFAQVLQATAASPARAARIRPGRSAPGGDIGRMRSERIMEEEDGWDVVEFGGEEGFG